MTAINNRLSAAHDWKAEMEAKKAFLQELIKNDDLDEAALKTLVRAAVAWNQSVERRPRR